MDKFWWSQNLHSFEPKHLYFDKFHILIDSILLWSNKTNRVHLERWFIVICIEVASDLLCSEGWFVARFVEATTTLPSILVCHNSISCNLMNRCKKNDPVIKIAKINVMTMFECRNFNCFNVCWEKTWRNQRYAKNISSNEFLCLGNSNAWKGDVMMQWINIHAVTHR